MGSRLPQEDFFDLTNTVRVEEAEDNAGKKRGASSANLDLLPAEKTMTGLSMTTQQQVLLVATSVVTSLILFGKREEEKPVLARKVMEGGHNLYAACTWVVLYLAAFMAISLLCTLAAMSWQRRAGVVACGLAPNLFSGVVALVFTVVTVEHYRAADPKQSLAKLLVPWSDAGGYFDTGDAVTSLPCARCYLVGIFCLLAVFLRCLYSGWFGCVSCSEKKELSTG
jgi:hypothetical protein